MAKLPVNISKARDAWKEVTAVADRSASILLAGDPQLVGAAQARLATEGPQPSLFAQTAAELGAASTYPGEMLVVLLRSAQEAEISAALDYQRLRGAVILAVDEGAQATGAVTRLDKKALRLSFSDTPDGWSRLFAACMQLAGHDLVALGRRYPALRPYAARRVVNQTAAQNALIGLLIILPGADLPAMALNQIKMVLYLAAMHGQRVDAERAIEIAAVIGLGLGLRGLARRTIGLVPGFGWLFKALIAYLSTSAMGTGAIKYFERGAPLATGRAVALVEQFRR